MIDTLPRKINLGSGKDFREDMFNIDLLAERGPDLLFDMGKPFSFGVELDTKRFGSIIINEGDFEYIFADNILEHLQDLITAMTNCLKLLAIDGIMEIIVPYDLSYGAWQDPTHVRAFNEKSWLYYTDWCWYIGWLDERFDVVSQVFSITPYGHDLMQIHQDIDIVAKHPRAVDFISVKLKKRQTTPEEKEHNSSFISM